MRPEARRGEHGQALPLAAVGLFAMALMIIATLNLGQAVHQKIKLQNTADSAAYTLAAMEARTFNYIAFLNRAQIAHYNTAMAVQSYLTWVGYQVAMYGVATDLLTTLRDAFRRGLTLGGCHPYSPGCPFQVASPAVLPPLEAALAIAESTRSAAITAYRAGEKLGHEIVEAMGIFNARANWQSQFARAALLNAHILTGMQGYIEKLDPDLSFKSGKSALLNWLVNSALNSIEYYQTFDGTAGLNPFIFSAARDWSKLAANDYFIKSSGMGGTVAGAGAAGGGGGGDDENTVDEAYRVMAGLCNASRSPEFVSNRGTSVDSGFRTVANVSVWGNKFGQTRMTEDARIVGGMIPQVRTGTLTGGGGGTATGGSVKGGYLSSDDFILAGQGGGIAGPAWVRWQGTTPLGDAIAAYEDGGRHYRYSTDTGRPSGVQTMYAPTSPVGTRFEQPNHAPWQGFAAYFKFKPNKERTSDYGQPSTWIFLNKSHKDFQTDAEPGAGSSRAPWYEKFSWEQAGQVAHLDTTVGGSRNSYLFEGINVVSRGMAYYHRPGNWTEHPNFFNPFWRARLAPVGQKLQNFWDKWVSSKISTSSDDQAVRAAVGVLRRAQMDLFTAVITSLVTH